jgi:ABC-2 type transport system permease protein
MRGLRTIYTIWLREVLAFWREPTRMIGMIGQPLLYLLIVGQGIASGLTLNRVPGDISYLRFLYPGILAMSMLFTSMFSAMSIIWDREFGFLKEVLVAPVPRWAVAVGKILGGATVAVAQSIVLILLGPLAGVWPWPVLRVVEILLLCFLISFAVTSLGVAIAARMRSMQGFQMLMNFLVMPLYFLSGAMFPLATAPAWMQPLMKVDPLTYGVDALRNVVFAGALLEDEAHRAGLIRWDLATDVGVLALLAVVLATVAALRFGRGE